MKKGIYVSKTVINFVSLSQVWANKTEAISIIFILLLMYNISNKSVNLNNI